MKEIVVKYTGEATITLSTYAHDCLLHGDTAEYEKQVYRITEQVLAGRVDRTVIKLQSYISKEAGDGEVRFA